ncbi:hypothetical protein [Mesorhizobium australicum]|uniref:Uncharacterized protein n=1 Tax=Mesorhizobium australicum TaxID=536018 RepID=A0A1X7PJ03_9HYPH|nr:hypothetical protein [Mesorhizobium australicum]SMH50672.1 hypothetical protein SAMN02982922_4221 [Mesorhizobium australicum]
MSAIDRSNSPPRGRAAQRTIAERALPAAVGTLPYLMFFVSIGFATGIILGLF